MYNVKSDSVCLIIVVYIFNKKNLLLNNYKSIEKEQKGYIYVDASLSNENKVLLLRKLTLPVDHTSFWN